MSLAAFLGIADIRLIHKGILAARRFHVLISMKKNHTNKVIDLNMKI
jgi:predicted transcriptional regulator